MSATAPQPEPDVGNNPEATPEKLEGGITGKGFQKGVSGNPSGRPKGVGRKIREMFGDEGEVLLSYAAAVISGFALYVDPRDPNRRVYEKVSVADRNQIYKDLMDRGFGKAPQFAPIEDADPLGLGDETNKTIAEALDHRLDELTERRRKRNVEADEAATG